MHHNLILRTLQATNVNLLIIVFHLSADSVYKVLNELVRYFFKERAPECFVAGFALIT